MKKWTKRQAQCLHTKTRARQRIGLTLNRWDLKELVKIVQSGATRFLERQSNRVSIHEVSLREKLFFVVYDSKSKSIVTVLTPDMRPQYKASSQASLDAESCAT